jgi:ABC-2 type transport system permease protein
VTATVPEARSQTIGAEPVSAAPPAAGTAAVAGAGPALAAAPSAAPPAGSLRRFGRLLAAERIKLASTRSPWWCAVVAVALLVGPTALVAAVHEPGDGPVWASIGGIGALPMMVVAVFAVLAATGEYRFGTVRITFLAAPDRASAVLAKTVVVAAASAAIGLVAAFPAWGAARLLAPHADLALATGAHWRAVAGVGLVYAVVAVFGVGTGVLLRHGGGALTALLVLMTVGEGVVSVLPVVGPVVTPWLPFTNLTRFLTAGVVEPNPARSFFGERELFGPWPALGYAATLALLVLALAVVVTRRRDA